MANVVSDFGVNILTFDFNRIDRGDYFSAFYDDVFVTLYGRTYPDVLSVEWQELGVFRASHFGGFGVQLGLTSVVAGTVTGYLEEFWNGFAWIPGFLLQDISVSASAIYNAVLTPDRADDLAIITAALSGDDTFLLSPFDDVMEGFAGNDILYGMGGNDVLSGGFGNDRLIGGFGADLFVYTSGADSIADFFRFEGDRIDLRSIPGAYSLSAVLANSEQVGFDTVISIDANNTLILDNVVRTSLLASDFLFAPPPPGPYAGADFYITPRNTSLVIGDELGVLANDLHYLPIGVGITTKTSNGAVIVGADGSFVYTPNSGFVGTDTFSYSAVDELGRNSFATTTITVGNIDALKSPAELITEFYVGYYNRAPDVDGLNYWINNYETPGSPFFHSVHHVAASFADPLQTETVTLYPFLANPGAADYEDVVAFLVDAYANLFGREVDGLDQGVRYWAVGISKGLGIPVPTFGDPVVDNNGALPTSAALVALIFGAQADDAVTIAHKVTVGSSFYSAFDAHDLPFEMQAARDAFDGVTADPASVLAAQAEINDYVLEALGGTSSLFG